MNILALDTETHLIRPGLLAPPWVCYTVATPNSAIGGTKDSKATLLEAIRTADLIVGQNIAYDFGALTADGTLSLEEVFALYDAGKVEDTKIREQLLDIAKGELGGKYVGGKFAKHGYSLANLAKARLNVELDKDTWRLGYAALDGTPWREWPAGARDYALKDAQTTLQVYFSQEKEAEGAIPDAKNQAKYAWALHLMACWGIRTDGDAIAKLQGDYGGQIEFLEEKMRSSGILRLTGTKKAPKWTKDTAKIRALIEAELGANAPRTDKTNAIATGEEAIEMCSNPALKELVEYSHLQKVCSTYLDNIKAGAEYPINPGWNVLVNSGRTSCREPNLQNLPRFPGVRECFIPRPGNVFVSVDYAAIELRTLAQICLWLFGESALADALNAGKDPHTMLGEDLQKRLPSLGVKDARQMSKCFHPDTEVLTPVGWTKITELTMDSVVCEATPKKNGGVSLAWVKPTQLTSRKAEKLVHLKNENFDLRVTDDHRMLGFRANGGAFVCTPKEINKARFWANAGDLEGGRTAEDMRLLRLAVATQADGSYAARRIRFGFSKLRKIDRLEGLLFPGEYVKAVYTNGKHRDTTAITLSADLSGRVRALLDSDKTLPWAWLSLGHSERSMIVDEAAFWDSTIIRGGRSYHYCTSLEKNADVLQALATITGRKARKVKKKDAWMVYIKDRHLTRGEALFVTEEAYTGDVVCLSVPATFVLVRSEGIPVIVGQCPNFGLPGGMGVQKFRQFAKTSYGLDLDEPTATILKNAWFERWPEMKKYFKWVSDLIGPAGEGSYKQWVSGRVRGAVGFCDGCNTGFQGLAADGAKDALYEVVKACYIGKGSPLYGCRVVGFIHDEILMEAPEATAPEAAEALARVMCEVMQKWVPDVKITAEPCLMKKWSKAAECVRDVNGRLIIWEEK